MTAQMSGVFYVLKKEKGQEQATSALDAQKSPICASRSASSSITHSRLFRGQGGGG